MKNQVHILIFFLSMIALMSGTLTLVEAQQCKASGKIRGKKPPKDTCSGDECCEEGKLYTTFKCSPPISGNTKAILTINDFEKGGDGGGPAECDGKYHSNKKPVVALSTGWFNHRKRCHKKITVHANGKSVQATVVDECDSTMGCDEEHGYQPPCPNNIVDASEAVWEALGVPKKDWGWMEVTWSEA